jgi:hypothetical protein
MLTYIAHPLSSQPGESLPNTGTPQRRNEIPPLAVLAVFGPSSYTSLSS